MFHFPFPDCKTVWKALQEKANIIFVCEEKEGEITLRKQLLLEVDEKNCCREGKLRQGR